MIRRISYVALLSIVATGLIIPYEVPRAHAAPLPKLDGTGTNVPTRCCYHSPQSQLLTTTRGHDVVLVLIEARPGETASVTDSSGLSFTQRLSFNSGPSNICPSCAAEIFEYYAITNPVLNADNITVTATGPGPCCPTIFGMQTIAVSGANTQPVFDQNPSIPATISCSSPECGTCYANGVGLCSATIETSTIDLIVATTAIKAAGGCGVYTNQAPPPGFTRIVNPNSHFEVDYTITNTPRSTVVFNCYGTDTEAIVLDAISFYGAFGT